MGDVPTCDYHSSDLIVNPRSDFPLCLLERGLEGSIDWFADRIIGVMFAGLLAGAFVLFDKLSNKLFNKQD